MHPLHLPVRATALRASLAAAALALIVACAPASDTPTATLDPSDGHAAHARLGSVRVTPGHLQAAEVVRRATARFADIAVARAAGYDVQYPAGCASSGAGAQGFHWLNEGLVDRHTNLLTPELLMYEPQADGSMVLVGVDYVIPFTEWKSPQPPVLLGVPMVRNEPLGVWALHIWAQRENPSGLFAPWNPTVSCRYAQP